ncbi:MAG: hypothetical protein ABSD67_20835 [Terracidiphilus sp.]|jgi:hypothetical protein
MTNNAEEILQRGSALLAPLLIKHGFIFKALEAGGSSGGYFASGEFVRDTRRLELHFRHSLGMVTYHLAARSMSHQDYMRSALGRQFASHYPGFSHDPLDAFRDLNMDLKEYGNEFLDGSDSALLRRFEDVLTQTKPLSRPPD